MNFKNNLQFLLLLLIPVCAFAQHSISGRFPPLAGQQVKLVGFQDFGIYTIDSTQVSKEGEFSLRFAEKDMGMGYLASTDNKAYFVVLHKEDIQLKGNSLSAPESITILSGKENQLFAKYASEKPRREQAFSAWDYLSNIYSEDPLFNSHKLLQQIIKSEKQRIKAEDSSAIAAMDKKSYLSWYLPKRALVSSVSIVAQYRTEEIPATIKAFRELDYSDDRLYKSGLLREAIENHIWLLENSASSLDAAYKEMYISIDSILDNLTDEPKKLNKITGFLFKLLEKHSLFKASEYLALKVLNQDNCTINEDIASQLESYRAMKIGNTAPDFEFKKDVFSPGYGPVNSPEKLSDIKSNYTVVIFGSSWCPACPKELIQINTLFQKWKKQDVEVVFVSLDDDTEKFKNFVKPFSFISMSDYQKWDSPVVKSYHVFGTPTLFLLDNKRKIVLRPTSTEQLDSWIEWYLIQGNK
ncbi:AhpC/TSA family protein [Aequorivita sp. F47161]|uniref:AhpC/TSA family protein n=1 Tax=Aequorivita vitellina TaxID=2874475 RepID=A0A9X1UB97_9FLAO|nr:TlpA disulfide reductase family protein [Aequorivita vitellina]MCG2420486.1 AhpC/TSA family protein [Aequorivita vitellina]